MCVCVCVCVMFGGDGWSRSRWGKRFPLPHNASLGRFPQERAAESLHPVTAAVPSPEPIGGPAAVVV